MENPCIFALVTASYYALHSLLASDRVKKGLQHVFVPYPFYRLGYNFLAIAGLMLLFYFYLNTDKSPVFPKTPVFHWIGLAILLPGLYLVSLSFKQYDTSEFLGTDRLQQREKRIKELNTRGMNRFVRHPLYAFSYLILIAIFLMSPNMHMLAFVVISMIYIPVGAFFEEKKLLKEYGMAYREYREKTPMLFPDFRKMWKKRN